MSGNELASYDGIGIVDIISSVDVKDLLRKIKQIDALKAALDSCDRFRENAIKYAKLEAAALVRVAELGGAKELKGHRRKVAEWLYGLSESERERFIRKCEEGLTIDQVWYRDIHTEEKTTEAISGLLRRRQELLLEVKNTGIAELGPFCESVSQGLPREIRADIVDGTRNALRKAGAVGLGDSKGTYVMPNSGRTDEIREAILMRYESVASDLANIKKIIKASKAKLSYKDFDVNVYEADRSGSQYLVHILLAIEGMGGISDPEDLSLEINKSSVYSDVKRVMEMLNCQKIEAAELVLQNYKAQEARKAEEACYE